MVLYLAQQALELSPAQIGLFAVLIVAFISGYAKLRKFEDRLVGKPQRTEITPQPLDVRAVSDFATKAELSKVEEALRTDLTKQAGARKEMHRDIEQLRVAQGVFNERSLNLAGQLTNLDDKVDRILDRLPRKA